MFFKACHGLGSVLESELGQKLRYGVLKGMFMLKVVQVGGNKKGEIHTVQPSPKIAYHESPWLGALKVIVKQIT